MRNYKSPAKGDFFVGEEVMNMKTAEWNTPDTEDVKALWDGGQNFPWSKEALKPVILLEIKVETAATPTEAPAFEPVALSNKGRIERRAETGL